MVVICCSVECKVYSLFRLQIHTVLAASKGTWGSIGGRLMQRALWLEFEITSLKGRQLVVLLRGVLGAGKPVPSSCQHFDSWSKTTNMEKNLADFILLASICLFQMWHIVRFNSLEDNSAEYYERHFPLNPTISELESQQQRYVFDIREISNMILTRTSSKGITATSGKSCTSSRTECCLALSNWTSESWRKNAPVRRQPKRNRTNCGSHPVQGRTSTFIRKQHVPKYSNAPACFV